MPAPADFQGEYSVSLSGATIPMETAGPARPVSSTAESRRMARQITERGARSRRFHHAARRYESMPIARCAGTDAIKLRGILVAAAKKLAIQTDAGETVAARFIKPKWHQPAKQKLLAAITRIPEIHGEA
jgi:hypothetical protein